MDQSMTFWARKRQHETLVPWVEVWRWKRRCYCCFLLIAALFAALVKLAVRQ